jgi:hypothetical protein
VWPFAPSRSRRVLPPSLARVSQGREMSAAPREGRLPRQWPQVPTTGNAWKLSIMPKFLPKTPHPPNHRASTNILVDPNAARNRHLLSPTGQKPPLWPACPRTLSLAAAYQPTMIRSHYRPSYRLPGFERRKTSAHVASSLTHFLQEKSVTQPRIPLDP